MHKRSGLRWGVIFSLLLSFIPAQAHSIQMVVAGTTCQVHLQKITYQNKVFTCLKKGNKLFWDNGNKISSPTPKTENLTFYALIALARSGGTDELNKLTINPANIILSRQVLFKVSSQKYFDTFDENLLMRAGDPGRFYLISPSGGKRALATSLTEYGFGVKFYGSLNEILLWDSQSNLNLVSNIQSTPASARIISRKDLLAGFRRFGLDADKEQIDEFVVIDKSTFVLATYNLATSRANLWKISYKSPNKFEITHEKQFQFSGSPEFQMALSPDKSKIAYKYSASQTVPNFKIVVLDLQSWTSKEIATSRYFQGFIGPITFLDNNNLALIPSLEWTTNDPNGGKVVCRLDLRRQDRCIEIVGIASLDVIGLS